MPYADADERRAYHKRYQPEWYQKNKVRVDGYAEKYKHSNPARYLFQVARLRAKRKGIEFSIELTDVHVPEKCPVLGIPLFLKERTKSNAVNPNSPSLDRIDPNKGYVKGNIQVISWRANNIKRDATPEELRLVADFVSRTQDR